MTACRQRNVRVTKITKTTACGVKIIIVIISHGGLKRKGSDRGGGSNRNEVRSVSICVMHASSTCINSSVMHVFAFFRLPPKAILNFVITKTIDLCKTVLASMLLYYALNHMIQLVTAIVLIVLYTDLICIVCDLPGLLF